MSAQHTPGVWSVSELDARGEKSEFYIFIEPGVAVIERNQAGQDACDMADAHLLSAAKELLAALEEAREGLRWYQDRNPGQADGSDDEAMARIDAAIAKATGTAA